MEHLIKRLEKSVAFAEKEGENMDDVSWEMQEGILISYNEAKAVIEALKAFKISSNPVLVDSLPLVIDLRDDGLYFIRQGNVEIIRQPEFEEDGRRWAYETIYRIGVVYKR